MWSLNSNRTITAGLTGQCLDQYYFDTNRVRAEGFACVDIDLLQVDVYDCNGGANQQWNVMSDLTIRSQMSGQCLTATYYRYTCTTYP